MKAYLVAHIEVHDPEGFAEYRERVAPLVARFGGRYLVRGGTAHPVEGDWRVPRLVIIEFDNLDAARTFYHSTRIPGDPAAAPEGFPRHRGLYRGGGGTLSCDAASGAEDLEYGSDQDRLGRTHSEPVLMHFSKIARLSPRGHWRRCYNGRTAGSREAGI